MSETVEITKNCVKNDSIGEMNGEKCVRVCAHAVSARVGGCVCEREKIQMVTRQIDDGNRRAAAQEKMRSDLFKIDVTYQGETFPGSVFSAFFFRLFRLFFRSLRAVYFFFILFLLVQALSRLGARTKCGCVCFMC